MNIFNLEDKEFDEALDNLLKDVTPDELLKELIECGLEVPNNIKKEDKDNETYIRNTEE